MTLALTGDTLDNLYPRILGAVLADGDVIAPRGMLTRELRGATIMLERAEQNVIRCPVRNLNYGFGCAEALWMLTGMNDVESVNVVNSKMSAFSDNGRTFYGAYGPMIADQLPYVIETLTRDHDSRQAVLTIWRPRPGPTKDVPCTVSMQFFVRWNAVHLHVHMRSNDVWLGLPYDIYNFTTIQHLVAAELGLALGSYVHHVGSLHLYETHYEKANLAILHDIDSPPKPEGVCHPFRPGDWCVPARVRAEFAALVACKTGTMSLPVVRLMREHRSPAMSPGFILMLDMIASRLKVTDMPAPPHFNPVR